MILFASPGASAIEKGVMAWYARLRGAAALILPRGAPPDVGPPSVWRNVLFAICYRAADKLVCQGQAWHRFAVSGLGFEPEDAPIIRNWTATPELLRIGGLRQAHAAEPVRLLFLGWLEREKGVLDLLEACARLPENSPFELELIGDGHAMPEARIHVAAHGLTGKVKFHGWLQGEAKNAVLARSDVLVLPSWSEGLPNAMIEAMAAKLSVVVTAVGNIPDVVTTGKNALVVPPRDPEALSLALHRIITDGALRDRLSRAAFNLAQSSFGVEPAVERLLAECQAAIAKRRRTP
ncbi:MAG: glycosyltransferase family 4 protein [Rubrivivax sp.]|nr:glycosyltransferase family 4 protein [Rubrivivax sp.]